MRAQGCRAHVSRATINGRLIVGAARASSLIVFNASASSEQASATIRGEARAREFLRTLSRILGDGDELGRAVSAIDDPAERVGFFRYVQKCIERAG